MSSRPKISVITITFNAEKVLERTMQSVLNQTFADIEYIIVDGESNDGTLDIIKQYANLDNRIRWISESDKGLYDAMNKGVKMATGEWINCMNAGDIYASNDVLENVFSKDYSNNITFLYSDNYYLEENGNVTYAKHNHKTLSILHQSCIYRRGLHAEHGYYIVTPKIIVSDLLFFASIPEEQFYKVDIPISCNMKGGVSASAWCITQALCTKVVFRKMTFMQMLFHMISAHSKRKFPFLKKIF